MTASSIITPNNFNILIPECLFALQCISTHYPTHCTCRYSIGKFSRRIDGRISVLTVK
ncbi:hypothetical protein LEP1GSC038_4272 [Leptospira weilii str. 2006001855]|uniref:Uncharacterized protein n=2 Tax=Leptospira weilii TaxID=28184 RepID=M6Q0E5_9LEPT|nr:hypothetical protein LEP1GSC038_4272 [Leptospira weilii str. 2006001855]EMN88779.1 hypothetical protein LEP1GSC108_1411 [Leptospira weilii str. UI 13098]